MKLRRTLDAAELDWSTWSHGSRSGYAARAELGEVPVRSLVDGFEATVRAPFVVEGSERRVAASLGTSASFHAVGAVGDLTLDGGPVWRAADPHETSMEHSIGLRALLSVEGDAAPASGQLRLVVAAYRVRA